MNDFLEAFRKYAVFEGRSRRSEYWYFFLFNFLISFALAFVVGFATGFTGALTGGGTRPTNIMAELPIVAYTLFALVPGLAVSVRRLHDVGLSGWWLLLTFVPLLGGIALVVIYCLDSEAGPNRFGPNPKGLNSTLVA